MASGNSSGVQTHTQQPLSMRPSSSVPRPKQAKRVGSFFASQPTQGAPYQKKQQLVSVPSVAIHRPQPWRWCSLLLVVAPRIGYVTRGEKESVIPHHILPVASVNLLAATTHVGHLHPAPPSATVTDVGPLHVARPAGWPSIICRCYSRCRPSLASSQPKRNQLHARQGQVNGESILIRALDSQLLLAGRRFSRPPPPPAARLYHPGYLPVIPIFPDLKSIGPERDAQT